MKINEKLPKPMRINQKSKKKQPKQMKTFKTKQRKTQKHKTLILKAPLAVKNRMLKGNVKLKTLKEPLAVSGVF